MSAADKCPYVFFPEDVCFVAKDSRQQASHGKTPSAGWLVTAVVAGALSFSRYNAAVFHDFAKVAGGATFPLTAGKQQLA